MAEKKIMGLKIIEKIEEMQSDVTPESFSTSFNINPESAREILNYAVGIGIFRS